MIDCWRVILSQNHWCSPGRPLIKVALLLESSFADCGDSAWVPSVDVEIYLLCLRWTLSVLSVVNFCESFLLLDQFLYAVLTLSDEVRGIVCIMRSACRNLTTFLLSVGEDILTFAFAHVVGLNLISFWASRAISVRCIWLMEIIHGSNWILPVLVRILLVFFSWLNHTTFCLIIFFLNVFILIPHCIRLNRILTLSLFLL